MTDLSKLSDAELQALYSRPPIPVTHQSLSSISDAELQAMYANSAPVDTMTDVGKSAVSGIGKGLIGLAGARGDVRNATINAAEWIANKTLGQEKTAELTKEYRPYVEGALRYAPGLNGPSSAEITQKAVKPTVGDLYEPKTQAGKYAAAAAEMIPATVALPGGGIVAKGLTAIASGIGGEFGSQMAEANGYGDYAPYARIAGSIAGGLTPSAVSRVVTPIRTTPERAALVDALQGEGVTSLTAGQRTGNKALQYAESILGDAPLSGQGASRIQQEGQRQFTEAAMRRAGSGPTATPEVLSQNYNRLGQEFRDLSARNNLVPDNQFITDLVQAARNYRRVPDSQQRAMVQGYIDDIIPHVNSGQMPGPYYQEMRSRLSRQANGLKVSDPTLSEALRDMRNALDNAMERSIAPADAQAWRTARRQYGSQKTIEKAASRAGSDTAEGQIVPSNLRNATTAGDNGAYARGEGDFATLARAGSGVMTPLPNSGTGQRNLITGMSAALGGGSGFLTGGSGAYGAIAGAMAPSVIGRALMSAPVQRYLSNRVMGESGTTRAQAIARALLAAEQGRLLARPAE